MPLCRTRTFRKSTTSKSKRVTSPLHPYQTNLYDEFRYLTKIMGKYAFGSWGASGARSGTQRSKGVGGVGGSADVEYALRAVLMVPIASDKLSCCTGAEGMDASSGPDGAATLRCVPCR